MSDPFPRDIQAQRESGELVILWHDEVKTVCRFWDLRFSCRCAHCVDERTGVKVLRPEMVPEDVSITAMEQVGGYAIRIRWTDGHNTGLYTWEHLREMPGTDETR